MLSGTHLEQYNTAAGIVAYLIATADDTKDPAGEPEEPTPAQLLWTTRGDLLLKAAQHRIIPPVVLPMVWGRQRDIY